MIDGDAVDRSTAASVALLPGEMADSDLPVEVEHWAAVYEELTDFLLQFNAPEEMVERYRCRLVHWHCRRDQLAGAPGTNGHADEVP